MVVEKTKKILKQEVYHLIRNDVKLREMIAEPLGIAESSVYTYAVRKSPTLQKPAVLNVIKKYTNKKETELFET